MSDLVANPIDRFCREIAQTESILTEISPAIVPPRIYKGHCLNHVIIKLLRNYMEASNIKALDI